MNKKFVCLLFCSLIVSGCSNSTPVLVSGLTKLQVPVVQPSSDDANRDVNNTRVFYSENAMDIKELQVRLKSKYLQNVNARDMFDNHSLSHQVYVALTNLEQSEMINEQYFKEGNLQGLMQLHQTLRPFTENNS